MPPHCGGVAVRMGRNFRPPPLSDARRWKVVLFLVAHGFRYGRYMPQPMPQTMGAARAYVARYRPDEGRAGSRYF